MSCIWLRLWFTSLQFVVSVLHQKLENCEIFSPQQCSESVLLMQGHSILQLQSLLLMQWYIDTTALINPLSTLFSIRSNLVDTNQKNKWENARFSSKYFLLLLIVSKSIKKVSPSITVSYTSWPLRCLTNDKLTRENCLQTNQSI